MCTSIIVNLNQLTLHIIVATVVNSIGAADKCMENPIRKNCKIASLRMYRGSYKSAAIRSIQGLSLGKLAVFSLLYCTFTC